MQHLSNDSSSTSKSLQLNLELYSTFLLGKILDETLSLEQYKEIEKGQEYPS